MTNNRTKKIVTIALIAAFAYILSLFEVPVIPAAPFLKIDFSDIPVFLAMYVFGPLSGAVVAFVRSLLQYITTGGDAGFPIGATAAFIATLSLTLPIYTLMKNAKLTLFNKILGIVLATISLTIMLVIVNYFFVLPAYVTVMGFNVGDLFGSIGYYLLIILVPFNIIKGSLISFLIYFIHSRMESWLNQKRKIYNPEKYIRNSDVKNIHFQ